MTFCSFSHSNRLEGNFLMIPYKVIPHKVLISADDCRSLGILSLTIALYVLYFINFSKIVCWLSRTFAKAYDNLGGVSSRISFP